MTPFTSEGRRIGAEEDRMIAAIDRQTCRYVVITDAGSGRLEFEFAFPPVAIEFAASLIAAGVGATVEVLPR